MQLPTKAARCTTAERQRDSNEYPGEGFAAVLRAGVAMNSP
jgi:hypothetical protein